MPPALSARTRQQFAWLVLLALVLGGALWWWLQGRPVALPDASSARIACVSYSPFHDPGESPLNTHAFISPTQISADLRRLSKYTNCVRTYSQGQGLSAVPTIAARYHMHVLMGIWLGSDPKANAQQMALGIATARAHPQVLRGVIVGNEVLLRGDLSEAQLAADIRKVRVALPPSIPVSYADVWVFWLRHRQLAKAVDFVTIHTLPYWENNPVPVGRAVAHVQAVYAGVQHAFPHKRILIGETGWPSAGRPRRDAVPSRVNEARYVREFLRYANHANIPYNLIEAFDQPWKRVLEGTAGGYWGIFNANGHAKFSLHGPVVNIPRWWLGWVAGGIGALVFALLLGWHQHRWRHALALILTGAACGMALAWQARQMLHACIGAWDWSIAILTCLAALGTALWLAHALAQRLTTSHGAIRPPRWLNVEWLRLGWLFALALYDLLLIFDGRYRDFPLSVLALPCAGFALVGWLDTTPRQPAREALFLAGWLPILGAIIVAMELGEDVSTWLWLAENLAIALPTLGAWLIRRKTSASAMPRHA
ncbi:MAG TPA: glycoside hydrolase family 17 [Rhodanobacteraceae bacterium]